jgi:hypothetical protein
MEGRKPDGKKGFQPIFTDHVPYRPAIIFGWGGVGGPDRRRTISKKKSRSGKKIARFGAAGLFLPISGRITPT